ncbi:MAG TPA: 3-deoxy-D-manno-octulosonic acid transferase [Acidobacteriaceae bacterium]|nr:3-deoxy-D-manno-octulosonic acid transferase [Acidobacteriaceae bacterium]
MLALYSFALLLVLVAGAPYWLLRMATSGKYREGLGERLGRVPRRLRTADRVIWVHAVSVGEVLAASRLIAELGDQSACRVMVSTTTRTGQRLARDRFGEDRVFYFPLDFGFAVRAYLRALRPRMVVLLETEFWPRMLVECRRAGIPVSVVNARISDRSWPRYLRLRFFWRHLLNGFAVVLAQSETDAKRLKALGASSVCVGGNLKYDIRVAKPAAVTEVLSEWIAPGMSRGTSPGAKVVVCGSTLEGEEELMVSAMPEDVVMVIAPRHPERFEAVAEMLERRSVRFVRRSRWMESPEPLNARTVFLLDSIGELASVYSLATVAVVGGGMFVPGGHNPLEPAQFGVPVMMGPHYENFRGIVEELRAADAVVLAEPAEFRDALQSLLDDEARARAMGARGRAVCEREAGATARAVEALTALLEVRV